MSATENHANVLHIGCADGVRVGNLTVAQAMRDQDAGRGYHVSIDEVGGTSAIDVTFDNWADLLEGLTNLLGLFGDRNFDETLRFLVHAALERDRRTPSW